MKQYHTKHLALYALLLCMFFACAKDDPIVENPSGETFIYKLNIVNGNISGNETYEGAVDKENKTIDFTIAAETDIQAVRFQGKLSLGARLDKETYDFSESLSQTVRVVNGENTGDYQVNVTLKKAEQAPVIQKMTVKLSDGSSMEAFVSYVDQTVYMKATQSNEVEITGISCLPKRATYSLTKATNGKVSKDDPGEIVLDFMGLKTSYYLSFANTPVFGADFASGGIYDFSANAAGASIHADFAAENTRSADFDGNRMLVVSRQGGNNPKILYFDDLKNGDGDKEKKLDITGLSGGTYVISAGRLSHGHIYICNLTTALADTEAGALKIYHWQDENATPETIFRFNGTLNGEVLSKGRFGDNLSVCLDENGNGYIFLFTQDGKQMLRLDVSGFNAVSNPYIIDAPAEVSYYASVNRVDGSENEYVLTSARAPIILMDKDGNILYKLDGASVPVRGTDARIIRFNYERYLVMTSGRAAASDPVQTLYVYDISSGANTVQALTAFEEGDKLPVFSYSLDGTAASAYAANTGWGIVNDELRLLGAATKAGFVVAEFSKKGQ